MVIIENIKITDIPVLHIADQKKSREKLPFIIFIHGFTSAKEHNLHYAYLLAEKGFRVILPEALYHGERNNGLSGHDLNIQFWEIVIRTIDELEILKHSFEEEKLIDPSRIGLVGTSMGGIVTLGALTKYEWVKTAASLMGMPYYEKFALSQIDAMRKKGMEIPVQEDEIAQLMEKLKELDLSLQPEKLENKPLLFWHGKQDTVVPYSYTYHFYETIRPLYYQEPEKLQFIGEENAGHKVSTKGVIETVKWFETYL
ncbi:prolyl oligopeptidase family serine peptidase [Bacillus sp. FJAT-29790]|uniref:prolyl oligopeptidase family serine peptidase n=1 Tax=Bacillus sp. FJAT-29790 TaxID=1895002 RepID=UPI001C21AED3|nr:prolyl oligopeptidase family serine peptidase [Bacillus sp. FJAT-29790]MBU8877434.1 prolyl oligopeptidase family serine peptidase [Bacillus sp. FJAT-29790]